MKRRQVYRIHRNGRFLVGMLGARNVSEEAIRTERNVKVSGGRED